MCRWIAGFVFAAGLACAGSAFAAPPPASAFGRLPAIEDAAISPDGQTIAYLGGTADHRVITIAPIDSAKAAAVDIGHAEVRNIRWAGNGYVLVRASVLFKFVNAAAGGKFAYHLDRDFVLTTQGQIKGSLLEHASVSNLSTNLPIVHVVHTPKPVALVRGLEATNAVHVTDDTRLAEKDRSMTVLALWRVDLDSMTNQLVERGVEDTDFWDVDALGQPVVRVDSNAKTYRVMVKPKGASAWKVLVEQADPDKRPSYLGYSEADSSVYLAEETQPGQTQVARYTVADGTRTLLGQPADSQEVGLLRDPFSRAPIALVTEGERQEFRWLDAKLGDVYAKLARAFPGRAVILTDWSEDRTRFVALVEATDTPPIWYLLDNAKGQLSPIGEQYPELQGAAFGKTSWITYKARDGLEIPAYLTLPPGPPTTGKMPLVVFPHGGPAARDHGDFDWAAQFMASRGYVVLQPQFRGSAGFGKAFEAAGKHEWGGKMQTDLLDGVSSLAAQGVIDPARVCIVGASYGGYAALAGATLHPEAYRCAVSINGVADLGMFVGESIHGYGAGSDAVSYWQSQVGKVSADAALIAASSPARHAASARAPVLLVASSDDTTVPNEQSTDMLHALQQAGRPVELVTLQGDDHYLSSSATRIQMLQAIEAFLAKNLPVN